MDLVSASCNISSLRDFEVTEDDRMELPALLSGPADHRVFIASVLSSRVNFTKEEAIPS